MQDVGGCANTKSHVIGTMGMIVLVKKNVEHGVLFALFHKVYLRLTQINCGLIKRL